MDPSWVTLPEYEGLEDEIPFEITWAMKKRAPGCLGDLLGMNSCPIK